MEMEKNGAEVKQGKVKAFAFRIHPSRWLNSDLFSGLRYNAHVIVGSAIPIACSPLLVLSGTYMLWCWLFWYG